MCNLILNILKSYNCGHVHYLFVKWRLLNCYVNEFAFNFKVFALVHVQAALCIRMILKLLEVNLLKYQTLSNWF